MALIRCLECNNQVSNTAATCPQCGAPIVAALGNKSGGIPLTTVQKTSKKLKAHIMFSSIIIWTGLFWAIMDISNAKQGEESLFPWLMVVVGFVWHAFTRFRVWWHHE